MKNLIALITIILFLSCYNKTKKENESTLRFFYVTNFRNHLDTAIDKYPSNRHNEKDSLLAYQRFEYEGEIHMIKMYTSDFYAPVDGGELMYELDSLGIIYSRSTTWYGYSRLRCNNDSLNSIIDVAIENIVLFPSMHCYSCNIYSDKKIKFTPPEIDKE